MNNLETQTLNLKKRQEPLMLGSVNIGNYVYDGRISDDKLQEIKEEIKLIKEMNLAYEKLPLQLLEIQKLAAHYPIIDPSFLSMSNKLRRIQVPKFSVYPFYGENTYGENTFSMNFQKDPHAPFPFIWNIFVGINRNVEIGSRGIKSLRNGIKFDLPEIIKKNLLKSLEFGEKCHYKNKKSENYVYESLFPIKSRKYFGKMIESTFNGKIPLETKKKVKKAEQHFSKGNIYTIAETKPEDWNVERITPCPLIVGVAYDKCFLIDHFDTTPMEKYVMKEFLE